MNKGSDSAHSSRENRRSRSESAHPYHAVGLKSLVNRAAAWDARSEATNESEDRRGINRRQPDGGKFFETKLRARGQREAVDFFFRNKQQHFVSAFAENFGDRDSRKEMAARSSTCSDRVHFVLAIIG